MLSIIRAYYGPVDVTNIVKSKALNHCIYMPVNNDVFGDTHENVYKFLEIDVVLDGQAQHFSIPEGQVLELRSKHSVDRLGVFYTNNHESKVSSTIELVIRRLHLASKNKADIICSVWNPIKNNPFNEYTAWFSQSGHLNQLLQILQLLYIGRSRNCYKYVSFLEHDVLYPEGYFDYPDFDSGILLNTNFIGIHKTGFQNVKNGLLDIWNRPLFQCTMLLDDAIHHFESLMPEAIMTNAGFVEPMAMLDHQRIDWASTNPTVHVNHGYHHTPHHTNYAFSNIQQHDYWGDYGQYQYLFQHAKY
jgi:hypothetical protein